MSMQVIRFQSEIGHGHLAVDMHEWSAGAAHRCPKSKGPAGQAIGHANHSLDFVLRRFCIAFLYEIMKGLIFLT